ncbi:hypothetical protein CKAH01_00672 [Colletotrichum kahawae]|uniref:Uncharacterized protein n=1 Tax=Colletotrichum kahawae TaxID=34407 RepID=A0AAD9YK21_COLKA|nr:hypothetical protein CKAH01_00672 [Colletotrichum kahawae]
MGQQQQKQQQEDHGPGQPHIELRTEWKQEIEADRHHLDIQTHLVVGAIIRGPAPLTSSRPSIQNSDGAALLRAGSSSSLDCAAIPWLSHSAATLAQRIIPVMLMAVVDLLLQIPPSP